MDQQLLPISVETLESKTKRIFGLCTLNVYVLVTTSKYWNAQQQRWLAMHVSRWIRSLVPEAVIYAVGAQGEWEHEDIIHITYDEFTTVARLDDLLILSCSHGCERSVASRSTTRYHIDYTAFAIDSPKLVYEYSPQDLEGISKVLALLADNASRLEMLKILYARISGDLTILQIASHRMYDHPCLFASGYPEGIYIDAGAFDGSESRWIKSFMPKRSKIIAFELDKSNYENHLADKDDNYITYLNAGLWSSNGLAQVQGHGVDARVTLDPKTHDQQSSDVRLVSLDLYIDGNFRNDKVVFLKMDIEGAEIEALMGASEILKTNKPLLAISIYHIPSDLWRIPLLIHSINPSYSFYISQHAPLLTETVLYAC
jgi:FkbM family methyltransferase